MEGIEKGLIVGVLVWLASCLVSWANPPKYELVETWHVVRPGETIWSIACDYYDEQQRYNDFGEWYYEVMRCNQHHLTGRKFLQVGDVVGVPVEKRVK